MRSHHIDVLALHGAEPGEVVRDDILGTRERNVRLNKATSIASSLESGLLGIAQLNIYGIIQVANGPFQLAIRRRAESSPKMLTKKSTIPFADNVRRV
jgi:hypothetical protein